MEREMGRTTVIVFFGIPALRALPHLYNTENDVGRLFEVFGKVIPAGAD